MGPMYHLPGNVICAIYATVGLVRANMSFLARLVSDIIIIIINHARQSNIIVKNFKVAKTYLEFGKLELGHRLPQPPLRKKFLHGV